MSRREDRIHGFSLVFQIPFYKEFDPAERMALYFTHFSSTDDVDVEFVKDIVHTAKEKKQQIDEMIEEHLVNWNINRLSTIDLALLRVAVIEMKYLSTPIGVAVNEAVELAKIYSTDEAPGFINGVLGGVADGK